MRRVLKIGAVGMLLLVMAILGYGAFGYWDAVGQFDAYAERANALIADGNGPSDLGAERLRQLILVQDPGYQDHRGVDFFTLGAGLTTISQSVSKRLGFDEFRPGIGKIRQTGFALGLESRLSKAQILALFLETVEMGRGVDGWITGFFDASARVYGRLPSDLSDAEFHRLLAVMIAPGNFRLIGEDDRLDDRTARIARLVAGDCKPSDQGDVWLEGCA